MPVDVGERAEAIPLHFVHPIAMIEGLARDGERHRCELRGHQCEIGEHQCEGGEHRGYSVFRAGRNPRAEPLMELPFANDAPGNRGDCHYGESG